MDRKQFEQIVREEVEAYLLVGPPRGVIHTQSDVLRNLGACMTARADFLRKEEVQKAAEKGFKG